METGNRIATRNEILSHLSDLYKDAYGYRPNLSQYVEYSDDDIKDELRRLSDIIKANKEEEDIAERENVIAFENLIDKTIQSGAGDRATALRWLYEASDTNDIEHFVWGYGILFTPEGEAIVNELIDIIHGGDSNKELSDEINEIKRITKYLL